MALRSLAKGTWGPAACALRCRSGAGMPAAAPSRFLASVRNQDGIAIRRLSYDVISARDMLKRAKKQEEVMSGIPVLC
ncbi:uncharacterized protein LOC120702388 isoform X2 [Panicum virgatum]|uniref:uncharacterized protein LOC120702388 isoform X2 n=1 Tax=Panicum virgatum TaxID=38727 RepID=UPI0019D67BAF|nr:uncharacterized protein LOC120702388 isoform X2 [Panicum virgatum]